MQRSAIFLDINMDGMDGLETARKIKAECSKVHIVLVAAYVNYALDGYKVKASRFFLKDDLEQTRQECMDDILREIRQEEQVVEFGFPAKAHGAVCHAGGWGIFRRGNG